MFLHLFLIRASRVEKPSERRPLWWLDNGVSLAHGNDWLIITPPLKLSGQIVLLSRSHYFKSRCQTAQSPRASECIDLTVCMRAILSLQKEVNVKLGAAT